MILAVRLPFSTIPIIHAWWPSPYLGDFISAQNRAACSRGKQISRPPGKEREELLFVWCWERRRRLSGPPPRLPDPQRLLHSRDRVSDLLVNSYHSKTLINPANFTLKMTFPPHHWNTSRRERRAEPESHRLVSDLLHTRRHKRRSPSLCFPVDASSHREWCCDMFLNLRLMRRPFLEDI